MAQKSMIPSSASRAPSRPGEAGDPLIWFRREMDRMFENFSTGFGFPALVPSGAREATVLAPRIETSETDRELSISAELPGIAEEDIDITLADDILTIRARKEAEREEEDRDYHLSERSYGTYARTLRLPFAVEAKDVQAGFENGVLTITIPKPREGEGKLHKIEVKSGEGGKRERVDRAAAGDKPAAAEATPQAEADQAGKEATS